LNIDGSPTVLLAKLPVPARLLGGRAHFVAAIRDYHIKFGTARRLRFANRSIDAFYTSHALEHLSRADCLNLLVGVWDWLKPGGVLRVVLPDLKRSARDYVCGKISADTFVSRTHLSSEEARYGPLILGHAYHLWMYDCASFRALLEGLGYRDIQKSSFGTSILPELARLDVEARREESFYIEALK
jgi:hypothetical protein